MADAQIDLQRGWCWGCGYELRGISSRRCPECGRAFDPDDSKTMNMTGGQNFLARWFIRHPPGGISLALSVAAALLLVLVTRWPAGPITFSFEDVRYLSTRHVWWGIWRHPAAFPWTDLAFIAGMELWALLVAAESIRGAARCFLSRQHAPGMVRAERGRVVVLVVMLLLVPLIMPVGTDFRLASEWVDHVNKGGAAAGPWIRLVVAPPPPPFTLGLSPGREDDVLRCGMRSLGAYDRMQAAGIVVETRAARGLPLLREAFGRESHPDVRAGLLILISMYRDPATGPLIAAALDDPAVQTRIAAADAMGILHAPAYPIPMESGIFPSPTFQPPIAGRPGPSISLFELVQFSITHGASRPYRMSTDRLADGSVSLPAEYRQKLEAMMLGAATAPEREAAARALVRWPPENYSLRISEWGVWIDDHAELKLAQSVLDEIPPQVHRLGNARSEFAKRINPITIITKPIMHITVTHPMAVDISAEIAAGRPWFAYPRPDDFVVTARNFSDYLYETNPDGTPKVDARGAHTFRPRPPTLAGLDPPPSMEPLTGGRQGYPNISPDHPMTGSVSGLPGAENDLASVGVRWQSMIVSPDLPAWAQLSPLPADKRFAWWSRLRQVPSSYVVSQGEAERFVYYDGPTELASPADATLTGNTLRISMREIAFPANYGENRANAAVPGMRQTQTSPVAGMFIRVRNGKASAMRLPASSLADRSQVEIPAALAGDAPAMLTAMLTEAGLSAEGAAGMVDAWRPQFFQTDGDRVLIRLPSSQYDVLCPIHIQPEPTTLVRVGIVLEELGKH